MFYKLSSGPVVSLKTNIFSLRVPYEEIFQFYSRIKLTFKWTNYQIRKSFGKKKLYFPTTKGLL